MSESTRIPRLVEVRLALLALGLAAVACGGDPTPNERVAEERAAVLYGEPSGPAEDGVLLIQSFSPKVELRCTGALVADNVVMTARHCVSNFVNAVDFSCTPDGELAPGSRGGQSGALLPPEDVHVWLGTRPDLSAPPDAVGKELFSPQGTTICRNDIALVVLDRPLSGLPIYPMRLTQGNQAGELVRAVGFGVDEFDQLGTRLSRSGLKIALVGESEFRPSGDLIPPRTFLTEGPALCIGDSGGPAFLEDGAITGVWSLVIGECNATTARNVFTQVAPFLEELVEPAFEAAGSDPLVEPGSEPTGSAGEGSDAGAGGAPDGSGGSAGNAGGPLGESGAPGEGGTPGEGGAGDAASPPSYHGPRKPGGCRCDVAGAPAGDGAFLAPLVVGLSLAFRRATSRGASSAAARARRLRPRSPRPSSAA